MNHKRRIGIVVAIGLLGLLFLLMRRPHRPSVATVPVAAERQLSAPNQIARPLGGAAQGAPPEGPVIEAIGVEKTEACNGEDNLVTVRLAGAHASDPNLRIIMPALSAAGPQMPFSLNLWDGKQPEMPEISVYGSNGLLTSVKIPTVTVKDCAPEPSLAVAAALAPNTSATYAFTATIRNPGRTRFEPVKWEWDFGDGAEDTTGARTVEHSYEDRPQKTRMSAFLIHVRAVDAQGTEVVGRTGLELRNAAYETLRIKHAIVLSAELSPRFPSLGADGRVTEQVRVHHAYDKPVTIETVILQRFRHDSAGRELVQETAIDPRQVLATNVIPPGSGVAATASLDTNTDTDVAFLTYELRGTSLDGIRAWGQFSVMRPPEEIPQEKRQLITDARLKAEILATRTILERDRVTQDDVNRLAREGAFDNLTVDDGDAAGGGQPAPAPPKPHRGETMGLAHPPKR